MYVKSQGEHLAYLPLLKEYVDICYINFKKVVLCLSCHLVTMFKFSIYVYCEKFYVKGDQLGSIRGE